MAAGIGSMNFYYERYSDTPGISTTQPLFNLDNTDPGLGWSNYNYKNFNEGYTRHGETPGDDSVPQPAKNGGDYVRYSDTPGVRAPDPQPYQRYDDQDPPQPIPNPVPEIIPNS